MAKESLTQIFARNLAAAMAEFDSGRGISQNQLAKDSGVGQTTISLYLYPQRRAATGGKSPPGPTLERVALLAKILHIEPYLLLHPDMQRARREQEMYRKIEEEYRQLPPVRERIGA
jgi:transcriptional regulator with XRE-family HTH domain